MGAGETMNDRAPRALSAVVSGASEGLLSAVRKALEDDGVTVACDSGPAPSRLDILVHIARNAPAAFGGPAAVAFAGSLASELKTAFVTLKTGVVAIRAGGAGGSIVVVAPPARGRAYDAVRQGLRLLVRSAALELGPEDIRVNIVLPGADGGLLPGAATVSDIAVSVAFAASARARFMTGADLVVDGGAMAR
jgi:3alpha(or 20beta)-hydroxysteroid dehydrogenase